MPLKTLKDLYITQLSELYNAEQQSVKLLPTLAQSASDKELRAALESHVERAREHVDRIRDIFVAMDVKPRGKPTQALKGLIEDCIVLSKDIKADAEVRDAALIAAAQHLQHDEIAGYGCARTWAHLLGDEEGAKALQQVLHDEKGFDNRLSSAAENINRRAVHTIAS